MRSHTLCLIAPRLIAPRLFAPRLCGLFLAAVAASLTVQLPKAIGFSNDRANRGDTLGQESTRVDVPAIAPACEWFDPFEESTSEVPNDPRNSTSLNRRRPGLTGIEPMGERMVEVVVPISWWLTMQPERKFQSFELEIAWARSLYPMVDYWPKSTLQSTVEGLIQIENQSERKASATLNTNGLLTSLATSASLAGEAKGLSNQQYAAIPQRSMLIASGPVERGTGAFFRFYDSPHELVQGGREVRLTFRVPDHWRGGLLRINAAVNWSRSTLLSSKEIQSDRKSFLLPVYLEGDIAARDRAIEYAQAESKLRAAWREASYDSKSTSLIQHLRTMGRPAVEDLPPEALESLILNFDATELSHSQKRLSPPIKVESAIKTLRAARSELLELSVADSSQATGTR